MPQMKPMNWLYLFIFFCMILMIFISLNFFMTNYLSTQSMNYNTNNNYKSLYWKW